MNKRQSGFSLPEMLVVIGIIAIVSLVTVPNFMALRRSNMLKNSMRNFMTDLRNTRQRAVTKHEQTKLAFSIGSATTGRQYTVWELDPATSTWKQVSAPKLFEQACYISTQQSIPTPDSGTTYEVAFRPDGTAVLPSGQFWGAADVKTDFNITVPLYRICVYYTGTVKALQGAVPCVPPPA